MSDRLCLRAELPARAVSVGVARGIVRSLGSQLHREIVERAELVLSELVTNAIRHGSPGPDDVVRIELAVTDDAVSGEVCDGGPAFTMPDRPPEERGIGGYGLYIAQKVGEVRVSHTSSGNAVSFLVVPPRGR